MYQKGVIARNPLKTFMLLVFALSVISTTGIASPVPAGKVVDVRSQGALCDGKTDDADAINDALTIGSILIPDASCYSSKTITVPPGRSITGVNFSLSEPTLGSRITCAITTSPCIRLTSPLGGIEKTSIGGQSVNNLTIDRKEGDIGISECLLDDHSFKVIIDHVNCNGHYNGFHFRAEGPFGIVANLSDVYTCNISGSDLVQDGFAELRISQGRFGCNTTRTHSHESYVLITGGASGPNTFSIQSFQFNDSINPRCAFEWKRLTASSPTVSEFTFINSHLEITGHQSGQHSIFCSDASAKSISRVKLDSMTFIDNDGDANVFDIDVKTMLGDWSITGSQWFGFGKNGWNLDTRQPIIDFTVTGNIFDRPVVHVNGKRGSTITMGNNSYAGGLKVDGDFDSARFDGQSNREVIITAHGPIVVSVAHPQ